MNDSVKPSPLAIGLLTAWCAAVAFYAFGGVLSLPYYNDELHMLQEMAEYHGRGEPLRLLFLPFNEHTIPLLRGLLQASVAIAGFDALPLRVTLLLVHAAGAVACGLLTQRVAGAAAPAWLAATLYAGSAGCVGSVLWSPTSAVFLLAGAFLAWSLVAVSAMPPGAGSLALGLSSFLLCLASLNGAAVAVVSILGAIGLFSPADARSRRRQSLLFVATAALVVVAARFNPMLSETMAVPRLASLAKGAWLVYIAPWRFAIAFLPPRAAEIRWLAGGAALAWAALLGSLAWLRPDERRWVAVLWSGPAALGLLIGLGRASVPYDLLFFKSRYYYLFLLPLTLHVGLLAGRVRRPAARAAVVLLVAAALWGSHVRFLAEIPWAIMGRVAHELRNARRLAYRVREATSRGPLHLADGLLPFPFVVDSTLPLSTVLRTEFPHGLPGMTIDTTPLTPPEEEAQNRIFDAWTPAPPVCVRNGRLASPRSLSWIDFRQAAFEEAQPTGFSTWTPPQRWIGPHASIVVVNIPGEDLVLVASGPEEARRRPVQVSVRAAGRLLGTATIDRPEPREIRFPVPAAPAAPLLIALDSDHGWGMNELFPGAQETAVVSVLVSAVGFPDPAHAGPCGAGP